METLIGIQGRDCVILAADAISSNQTLLLKDNQSKIRILSKYCMIGALGDNNDTAQFCNFLKSHIQLYDIQNGYPLNPQAIVHFASNKIISNRRSRVNSEVAMLLGGYDKATGSLLSSIDPLGVSKTHNYALHGMGQVCNKILQLMWKPDLSCKKLIELIRMCVNEIEKCSTINKRCFHVFVVDKNGLRQLFLTTP